MAFQYFSAQDIFQDALPQTVHRQRPEVTPIDPVKAHPTAKLMRPKNDGKVSPKFPNPPDARLPSQVDRTCRDATERAPKLITLKTCLMPSEAREVALELLIQEGTLCEGAAELLRRKIRRRSTKAIQRRSKP